MVLFRTIRPKCLRVGPCLVALLFGVLLTCATIGLGVVYCDGRFLFGVDTQVPDPGGKRSYDIGWFIQESGDVLRFSANVRELDTMSPLWKTYRKVACARGARQRTRYWQHYRGFPFLCVSYFESPFGPYGFNSNVPQADLEVYPRLKFDAVLWGGLVGDLLIWSSFSFVVISIPRWIRHRSRRRKGLCVNCGYDLRGTTSGVCSECGVPASTPDRGLMGATGESA